MDPARQPNSKRKVPDFNDNFDGVALPALPPPALRNASCRRMTIAGGTLPATLAALGIPAFGAHHGGHHGGQARRQAEEDHADSLYNNYITTLALKLRAQRATAKTRQELDSQLSTLQSESLRMKQLVAETHRKQNAVSALVSTAAITQTLSAMLAEQGLAQFNALETLSAAVNGHMNSLNCIEVRPLVDGQEEFGKVEESINELGENFCIPHETMESCAATADCLREIGNSMNAAEKENKCLDQLKDTNYSLLAQNFSNTMKL